MNPQLHHQTRNSLVRTLRTGAVNALPVAARLLAGVLLVAVSSAPALLAGASGGGLGSGLGDSSSNAGNSGAGTVAGGGDETVGTLPMVGVRLDFVRHARLDGPCLAIEGRFDDIVASILAVRGSSKVRLDPLPGGRVRAVFVGDVRVAFSALPYVRAGLAAGMLQPDGTFRALPAEAVFHDGAAVRLSAGGRTVAALRNAEIFLLQRR